MVVGPGPISTIDFLVHRFPCTAILVQPSWLFILSLLIILSGADSSHDDPYTDRSHIAMTLGDEGLSEKERDLVKHLQEAVAPIVQARGTYPSIANLWLI